jgi:hypothetical protein
LRVKLALNLNEDFLQNQIEWRTHMTPKGKTGNIHGVEVKARARTQEPTVTVTTDTVEGRKAVLLAVEKVYEQHREVIQALANR